MLKKWGIFFTIAFSPGSAVFVLFTLVGLFLAYHFKENTLFSTLLSIISSIFAGIGGNFIKDDYDKLMGKNILEKKGRSALRNLQGINTQLLNLRNWIACFITKKTTEEEKQKFIEIDRHIETTQLNISAGLEDWIDIVPELREGKEKNAELEKQYRDYLQVIVSELIEKKKELTSSKDDARTEELKKKISNLEKEMKELKRDHFSIVKPLEAFNFNNSSSILQNCSKCASLYIPNPMNNLNICDACKNKGRSSIFKQLLP